ncbi:hypothetical protein HPB47_010701 [Ixodes persulcatus]|uniref:Uncharacterized protein n=1 Tax=Ixodes persulcatus TaxID=34615 RepID=A0AC60NYC7_IXOPE|nr:hypothetical protein HPB47_010701 [Ixodes persulcatus]
MNDAESSEHCMAGRAVPSSVPFLAAPEPFGLGDWLVRTRSARRPNFLLLYLPRTVTVKSDLQQNRRLLYPPQLLGRRQDRDRRQYDTCASCTQRPPPQPTKALTFDVSCPPGASVDSIFDTAAGIVGTAELFFVQHLGATNFRLSVTSSSPMSRIVNAGALSIGGTLVPIVPVGPQVTTITCLFLPVYVKSEALSAALAPYGKVLDIRFGVYQDHPTLRTGTRYTYAWR